MTIGFKEAGEDAPTLREMGLMLALGIAIVWGSVTNFKLIDARLMISRDCIGLR